MGFVYSAELELKGTLRTGRNAGAALDTGIDVGGLDDLLSRWELEDRDGACVDTGTSTRALGGVKLDGHFKFHFGNKIKDSACGTTSFKHQWQVSNLAGSGVL